MNSPFETAPPPAPHSAPPRRSNSPWAIVIVLLAVIVLVPCVCGGIFLQRSGYIAFTEHDNIERFVNVFLQQMENRDADTAYAMFSPSAKEDVSHYDILRLIIGSDYRLFRNFKRASIHTIEAKTIDGKTVAEIRGRVYYERDVSGSFQGTVALEGDRWMMVGFQITLGSRNLPLDGSE